MRRFTSSPIAGLILVIAACAAGPAQAAADPSPTLAAVRVPFVPNPGHFADPGIAFHAATFCGAARVMADGALVYGLRGAPGPDGRGSPRGCVLRETLLEALPIRPQPAEPAATRVNYFVGDRSRWRSDIPTYAALTLGEVYPGITLSVRAHGQSVEKIFTVAPGADPAEIAVALEGVEGLAVAPGGELVAATVLGAARFSRPVAYQEIGGQRRAVAAVYVAAGARYGFEVGAYDPEFPLVIDPLLASTYLGSTAGDYAYALAFNSAGEVYVTGVTWTNDFPTTPGAFDTTHNLGADIFVSRLDPNLTNLLASTYLGGYDYDSGWNIACDASDNIIIAGNSFSPDYPTTPGAYATANRGESDIVISKLNGDLSILLASTMVGGMSGDVGYGLALDPEGNLIISGYSISSNFPTTAGAYCRTWHGNNDAVICKLDSGLSNLLASTYLGGNDEDVAYAMTLGSNGAIYVTGSTESTNFPTTPGAYDRVLKKPNVTDIFVSCLDANLTNLLASTLVGGISADACKGIALDASGNVFIAGFSQSTNYPVTSGAYQTLRRGAMDAVISKLDGGLTSLLASTYLGGNSAQSAKDIALDADGHILITGSSCSDNYPTTPGAYDPAWNGDYDAVVTKLDGNLATLLCSTFIGGSDNDEAYQFALDRLGRVYVVMQTASTNYPATAGAYQTALRGSFDGAIAKLDSLLSDSFHPPTGVAATKGAATNGVQVTWSAVSGATRYTVYRHTTNNAAAAAVAVDNVAGASCEDTSAEAGVPYYYWVQAKKTAGASDVSAPDIGWRAFSPPADFTASDGDYGDRVQLSWAGVSNVTGYAIWRNIAADTSTATLVADQLAGSPHDDWSAVPGQLYHYWIAGSNALCASAWSPIEIGWRRTVMVSAFADLDFDGDRKMDLLTFEPESGRWRVKLSAAGYSDASAALGDALATAIPADFDGDRLCDPAIFEALSGDWTVKMSGAGYAAASLAGFGSILTDPVVRDYDGDGKADPAVFRESDGLWTIMLSGSGYLAATAALGATGATAVPADYDGDLKADPAVYEEATGNWQVMLSGSGYAVASLAGFGGPGCDPVQRDFDGDLKADPATYHRASGQWTVALSASGYLPASATCGDLMRTAVPGDYDGDGKADLMVYEYTRGDWLVMLSASGYTIARLAGFGGPGCLP